MYLALLLKIKFLNNQVKRKKLSQSNDSRHLDYLINILLASVFKLKDSSILNSQGKYVCIKTVQEI